MYSITELKKGTLIQLDGRPYQVVDYAQKVMGRGGSIVNVRIKSLPDGAVIAKTFKGSEKIEPANISNRAAQYLYADASGHHFMDNETFEQFDVSADLVGDAVNYLTEGSEVDLQFFEGQLISVELPNNLYLEVTYTESVVRGDTATSVQKDATLSTGYRLRVPAFIKIGDTVKVDTRTGEYIERKKV